MKKRRDKATVFSIVFMLFLAGLLLFYFGPKERERRNKIETYGETGLATVLNKSYTNGYRGYKSYDIVYDIYYNGTWYDISAMSNYKEYENAIIEMKYKVMFLPGSPEKNSIIYIDEPIVPEYDNIRKELERIKEQYPYYYSKIPKK